MDCREFNSMIWPHLDGLLQDGQPALLEDHAAHCTTCARELALQSRMRRAMRELGHEEIAAPPELGRLVISSLRTERRGWSEWIPQSWRKTVATAAAMLLLAGGSAGVINGMQIFRDGKIVVAVDPPAVVDDGNSGTDPADGGGSGLTVEGLPGNKIDVPDPSTDDTGSISEDGEAGKAGAAGTLPPGGTALLNEANVITSTVLKIDVADLASARVQAVALAAGSWASTQVFPEQSGDKKIVVLRMTVDSDMAPGLIEKLTTLGTLSDRHDESRDITASYNETQVLCSELESKRDTVSDPGEQQVIEQQISSYRQQLDAWEAEAGKRVITLWLEN